MSYDVEIETMDLKLENLIEDSDFNTGQLLQIMSQAGDNKENLTINDIKKRYHLTGIHEHKMRASNWI